MSTSPAPVRTIAVLSMSQALSGANGAIVVAVGGLAAARLAPFASEMRLRMTWRLNFRLSMAEAW